MKRLARWLFDRTLGWYLDERDARREAARLALIADWMRRRDLGPTVFLGPLDMQRSARSTTKH